MEKNELKELYNTLDKEELKEEVKNNFDSINKVLKDAGIDSFTIDNYKELMEQKEFRLHSVVKDSEYKSLSLLTQKESSAYYHIVKILRNKGFKIDDTKEVKLNDGRYVRFNRHYDKTTQNMCTNNLNKLLKGNVFNCDLVYALNDICYNVDFSDIDSENISTVLNVQKIWFLPDEQSFLKTVFFKNFATSHPRDGLHKLFDLLSSKKNYNLRDDMMENYGLSFKTNSGKYVWFEPCNTEIIGDKLEKIREITKGLIRLPVLIHELEGAIEDYRSEYRQFDVEDYGMAYIFKTQEHFKLYIQKSIQSEKELLNKVLFEGKTWKDLMTTSMDNVVVLDSGQLIVFTEKRRLI